MPKCPNCQLDIDKNATSCPYCLHEISSIEKAKMSNNEALKKYWWVGLLVILIAVKMEVGKHNTRSNSSSSSYDERKRLRCDYCGDVFIEGTGEYSLPNSAYSGFKFCSKQCLNDWARGNGIKVSY